MPAGNTRRNTDAGWRNARDMQRSTGLGWKGPGDGQQSTGGGRAPEQGRGTGGETSGLPGCIPPEGNLPGRCIFFAPPAALLRTYLRMRGTGRATPKTTEPDWGGSAMEQWSSGPGARGTPRDAGGPVA